MFRAGSRAGVFAALITFGCSSLEGRLPPTDAETSRDAADAEPAIDAASIDAASVDAASVDAASVDAPDSAMRALCLGPELTAPGSLVAPSGWRPNPVSFGRLSAMTLDSLGRTLLAGQYEHRADGGVVYGLIERWIDGVPDTTFGPNGSRLFQQSERAVMREESFTAVTVETGGGIFAAGWARMTAPAPHHIAALGRFLNDGSADRAFGIMGAVEFRAPPTFAPRGMLADGLGVLLVGAPSPGDLGEGGYGVRVLSSGVTDRSFGADGVLAARDLAALAAPLRVGQDYLVAAATLPARAPALLRLTSAGARATSFGVGGLAVFPGRGQTFPVALEPAREGGWLLLSGQVVAGPDAIGTPLVLRVLADGSLDPGFADRGALALDAGIVRPDTGRQSLVELCDGSFLVLREDLADGMIVSRYSARGVLDARFGDRGSVFLRAGSAVVQGLLGVEADRATARVVVQASDRRLGYFRIAL